MITVLLENFLRWIDKVDRFFVASNYEMEVHEKAFKIPKNLSSFQEIPEMTSSFVRRIQQSG